MSVRQSLQYFGVQKPWDVIWVHRVNSPARWEEFVRDSETMIVEGDIRLRGNEIVMQHEETGDFTMKYQEWLDMLASDNIGLKLDFKEPAAVAPCLKILKKFEIENRPIVLNADILDGPGGGKSTFDAEQFIDSCKEYFPNALLSIGWKTKRENRRDFTSKMIERALSLSALWDGDIVFAVELSYVKDSWTVLAPLLNNDNHFLSLWNVDRYWNKDHNASELMGFISDVLNPDRVFQDFVDEMEVPVRL